MAKIEIKPIKGFPGYSVSSEGIVYSSKRGTDVVVNGSVWLGYRKVSLCNGPKKKTIAVHRLVAETFLTKPRGLNLVNHIDGDKSNNKLSNLEWTNHRGNAKHYEDNLAPIYKAKRVVQKQDKLKNNLAVVQYAYETFKDDAESFRKVYEAVFVG